MAGSASDDDDAIALEITQLGSQGAPVDERALARELVRAKLQLGTAPRQSIGRYQLVRTVGRGGMGVVMVAHDPELDREVAIKVLRPHDEGTSERAKGRLLREARSIAKLSHPNVVQVHDAGVHEGRVYVVMEYVPGTSLRRWLDKPRDWLAVVDLLRAAGRGLLAAHRAGIVHRDFKPANVLVGKDHRPRVVDFGLARPLDGSEPEDVAYPLELDVESLVITATGAVLGTPAYMAPEQFVGAEAGPRTDQFAFCVTLFEALTGARPFSGTTFAELCHSVLHGGVRFGPESEHLPSDLRDVLARGLRRRRSERFADMAAVLEALERAVEPHRGSNATSRSPSSASASASTSTSASVVTRSPEVVRERFPRLYAYLEGLEDGAQSHPECVMRAELLRLALAHHPIEPLDVLPPSVAAVVRTGLADREWLPQVMGRVILTAIREIHFVPGPEGDDAWARMLARIQRAAFSVGFVGFALPGPGSERLLGAVIRAWTDLYRGTRIETERREDGRATLYMAHPPGLLGALGSAETLGALQTAMSLAGVKYTDARVLETDVASLRFELHWA